MQSMTLTYPSRYFYTDYMVCDYRIYHHSVWGYSPLSMIEGAFLKYFGIPVALTWFMSQKTFDGKKPYSFLKSQITYALRPKITYAGKAVKLHKQILNETITAVRSVNYVPDKIY